MDVEQIQMYEDAVIHFLQTEPREVYMALVETIIPPMVSAIVKKHHIPLNRFLVFENYVYLLFAEEVSTQHIHQWLIDYARISNEEADSILFDIEKKILNPIQKLRIKNNQKHKSIKKGGGVDISFSSSKTTDQYREIVNR